MRCERCGRDYDPACPVHGVDDAERATLPPVDATPLAGVTLADRYVIRGVLGRGAMGTVYLASDARGDDPWVAVKMLDDDRSEDERARLRAEAVVGARVRHPHVLRYLDAGETAGGAPFVVVELLVGESLGERLRRVGTLPREVALPLFRQVASALAAAHAAGVVHRDVKPDNLFLVGPPGAPVDVRVVDFGLAKLDGSTDDLAAGIVAGTCDFMAPEQALSDPVDARTDVYALGLTMFAALTGRRPFSSPDQVTTMARQIVEHAPRASSITPDLDGFDAVLQAALRKVPGHRYRSMRALADDLARLERGGRLSGAHLLGALGDVYVPRTQTGKIAAAYFYTRLGLSPPF
ncbi:MAG: serine/threonine protein kinase [Polyangiaceae bacterium]|nr:serine/threonine protein kinase [Polyangiaceae bacterium]